MNGAANLADQSPRLGTFACGVVAFLMTLGITSPPAQAARVKTIEECQKAANCEVILKVVAEPRERNFLSVRSDPDGAVVVTDAASPLTPGSGCQAIDAHTVTCMAGYTGRVDLGDGDDQLDATASGMSLTVTAGAGTDQVMTGTGGDHVSLDGHDTAKTGRGKDKISAGTGTDIDAGAGRDLLYVPSDIARPRVDLAEGRVFGDDGATFRVQGVEDVDARSDDAVVRGDDHTNLLTAGAGSILDGRGGNDELYGSGTDHLICGPGEHDYVGVDLPGLVSADCERVEADVNAEFVGLRAQPGRGRAFTKAFFGCYAGDHGPVADLVIQARIGDLHGRLVAKRRVRVRCHPYIRQQRYGLRLSDLGEQLLDRRHRLRVVVYANGGFHGLRYGYSMVLRRPAKGTAPRQ